MEFSFKTRLESLNNLKDQIFDILVIGGGITGAGIALDAALRGLKVITLEKEDFASGTSSKSSKLLHGGLRYLRYMKLKLVFEALRERGIIQKNAQDITRYSPFIIPIYSVRELLQMGLGIQLYNVLTRFKGKGKMISQKEVLEVEPNLREEKLKGGMAYHEFLVNDARLVLEIVKSAFVNGAVMLNYAEVFDFIKKDGKIVGVKFRDRISGKNVNVSSRIVINATGPWVDNVRGFDEQNCEPKLRITKGSHIVLPRAKIKHNGAVAIITRNKRYLVIVPWGDLSIIGTTDTDYKGDLDRVYATPEDADYLLRPLNEFFKVKLTERDIISAYAGLRPLIDGKYVPEYKVSREHEIFEDPSGLISIAGGKLTTYRVMAKEAVDYACKKLKRKGLKKRIPPAPTDRFPLEKRDWQGILKIAKKEGLNKRISENLPYTMAEIPYAIWNEMTLTLKDFLMRRTYIIYEDEGQGLSVTSQVAQIMGKHLNWTSKDIDAQLEEYQKEVELVRFYRNEKNRNR